MNATTQEAPSHLQSLQEQRDALEAEIERISAKESEDKCKPLCAEHLRSNKWQLGHTKT